MSDTPPKLDHQALLQRASDTIAALERRLARLEQARREPIAIVGMGMRLPGDVGDAASFWRLLCEGVDAVGEIPPERWDVDAYYDPNPDTPGKTATRWGAFLNDVDAFDGRFFGISPREAAAMDPQQRLLLEVSWEALENAGRASAGLAGSATGVFVGMAASDYSHLPRGDFSLMDGHFATGISRSIAAGRISYAFGLHGPAFSVDTACSSSAVATHLACLSLRAGECDMALAGGVNLTIVPDFFVGGSRGRMLSPTGRCRTFDESADGYVRGEGCAMLVLRRLSDALAAGDNILAVILGTGINQDGRSNGITAPNGKAQETLLRATLADAGIEPGDIGFIEAHGTGTSLGDPVEVQALGNVFAVSHSRERPLMLGSAKTNIGHLEAVAGTAGLIKLVLALQHKTIPPHLHLRQPNPHIPWDSLPITVPTTVTPWRAGEGGRLVGGVSSFGFSGTNSHMIVAEAPPVAESPSASRSAHLVALSAHTPPALTELAERYERHLAEAPQTRLADIALAANTGRTHEVERLAVVASSTADLGEKLAAWRTGDAGAALRGRRAAAPEIAFLFTGQGSQHIGMGRRLYETEPVFRTAMERCDQLLRSHLERPLLSVIFGEGEAGALIDQTAYTQPALFALEYSLAQLWRSWGIEPALMLGHSVGEYVAACVAGVLTLEDALQLIAERGRLMQAMPAGGAMAAVFADEATVAEAVAPHAHEVAIAAVNGPDSVVVSGAGTAVEAILKTLEARGIKAQPLTVSHAFHSPLMEPMLDAFAEVAASVRFFEPRIGVVSNVTGTLAGPEIATPAYWREHVRAPVRFADGVRTLRESGCAVFLEVGPGTTLLGMGRRCLPDAADALWAPSLRAGRDDVEQVLESLGALYARGAEIDWDAVEQESGGRRIPLPTYPFQRQRYWLDIPQDGARMVSRPTLHPLVHERLRSRHLAGTVFQSALRVDAPSYLNDHRIYGVPLFPATGFIEMAWVAARQVLDGPLALEQVQLREALALPEPGERTVQVAIIAVPDGGSSFEISSLGAEDGDDWTLHATGRIRRLDAAATADDTLDELRARCVEELPVAPYYERVAALGAQYGPVFRGLRQIQRRDGEALARIELSERAAAEAGAYQLHPALLDACIQILGAACSSLVSADGEGDVFVPVDFGTYALHQAGCVALWCHARVEADPGDGDVLTGDLRLLDADGATIAELGGVRERRVSAALIQQVQRAAADPRLSEWLYRLDWQPAPAPELQPDSLAGRWLVLADEAGVGARLAERIEAGGGSCALLRRDGIDPLDLDGMARALRVAAGGDPDGLRGVVHLYSLDAPDRPDPAALDDHQRAICGSALSVVQAAATVGIAVRRLHLVTRGAQWTAGYQAQVSPAPSALWGLASTIGIEHPELGCVAIDLDPSIASDPVAAIVAGLGADDGEDRVAWRAGRRFVARLGRYAERAAARTPAGPVELDITERGVLDKLVLRPVTRRAPGPGEVEVQVRAIGLNFRDVLNALGMYPGPAGPVGSECAGTVVAVGEGVSSVAVGDEVIALGAGTFCSYLITRAHSVHPKPAGMSFAEAASIPIAFLTAYYGLHILAGIKRGDRVLVHAAAGGVGLAAVQLALAAGAEVFGTAGNPQKRAFLESLGVRHVASSRTLDFADEIMAATGGRGVDIVLNALADDFIPKSLSMLADGGCFLEIGKRGIWTPEQVAALNPRLRYHVYDLADALQPNSGFVAEACSNLLPLFEAGALWPLPLQIFPLAEVGDAFRFMAQARHTGKIVVVPEQPARAAAPLVRADATYLITGGLGGLGLAVARWLVGRGARSLVLAGRSEPSPAALEAIARLEGEGARVVAFRGDVASAADTERLLDLIAQEMPPLRGVIHAAGVLDDGVLQQQSWPRFQTVMRPKVQGAWNLHAQTAGMPLDFFVLFSTGSALMGAAGQGNYAAANAFLDGLAHHRRALGLAATTINWGPWSEVGMAAGLGSRDLERWKEAGLGMIAPAEGVRALERLLTEGAAQAAVLPFDWARVLRQDGARPPVPFFARMLAAAPKPAAEAAGAAASEAGFLDRLRANDPDQRLVLLQEHVRDRVIRVLALSPSTPIDATQQLAELGMDSLMAVELSNHLQSSLGVQLPSTLAFEHPTLGDLTAFLAAIVLPEGAPRSNGSGNGTAAAEEIAELAGVDALAGMSDDEVEAALRRELEAQSG